MELRIERIFDSFIDRMCTKTDEVASYEINHAICACYNDRYQF